MFYTYILYSKKDEQYYTGFTECKDKRIKEHLEGKVKSTRNRNPLNLIYYETCLNKYDALRRESYLKSGTGKRYLKNRLKYWNKVRGLKEMSAKIENISLQTKK